MLEPLVIYGQTVIYLILVCFGYASIIGLLYLGIDRKLVAHMQGRVGPPIRQPFRDLMKLFSKESVIPLNATKLFYVTMPVLSLASMATLLLYIPLGPDALLEGYGDLILIIYLLTLGGLSLVFGSSASNSIFGNVGAQRELVLLLGYEIPLCIVIFGLGAYMKATNPTSVPFSIAAFRCVNLWDINEPIKFIGVGILFVVSLCCVSGLSAVGPFEVVEAETEIAGGPMVEYSGRLYGLFYLSNALKLVAVASLVIAIFFPQQISLQNQFLFIPTAALIHLGKMFCIIFFAISVLRAITGRWKITQVIRFYWITLSIVAIIGLFLLFLPL